MPHENIGALPKIWGVKTTNFRPLFSATSALDTAYLRNETSYGQTKMTCQSTMYPLQGDLLSVTLDPETAEILMAVAWLRHPLYKACAATGSQAEWLIIIFFGPLVLHSQGRKN